MTGENDPIASHIKERLASIVAEPSRLEKATSDLRESMKFLGWKPPPGASFYDFAGKVEQLSGHFAKDGLGRDDIVDLINKHPILLISDPITIISNVEGVANHFSGEGLTAREYVACGMADPWLFGMKPATIINRVAEVVGHFAADGLSMRDYIRASIRQPSLFSTKSETVIARVEGVLSHFPGESRRTRYLAIAMKTPTLFTRSGEAIGRTLNLISDLLDRKLIGFRGGKHDSIEPCDLALKYPQLLCYSEENILARELSVVLDESKKINSVTILKSRPAIEREIHTILGNSDPTSPVAKATASDGPCTHARNLLLRALIHEGLIGGRNVQ